MLFISAVVYFFPFTFVIIIFIGSMCQLHLDSSIREFRYCFSYFILEDLQFARIVTGLMKGFPLGRDSLLLLMKLLLFKDVSKSVYFIL